MSTDQLPRLDVDLLLSSEANSAESVVDIQVYAQRGLGKDDFIGGYKEKIGLLLVQGTTAGTYVCAVPKNALTCHISAVSGKLRKYESSGASRESQTSIKFNLESMAKSAEVGELEMDDALMEGKKAMKGFVPMPRAVGMVQGAVDTYQSTTYVASSFPIMPVLSAWEPFLEKVELFTNMVDGIAEVGDGFNGDCEYDLIMLSHLDSPICKGSLENPFRYSQGALLQELRITIVLQKPA